MKPWLLLPVFAMSAWTVLASGGGSAPNRPPVAVSDQFTVSAGGSILIDVTQNDSDPDNDSVSVGGLTAPLHGTVIFTGPNSILYSSANTSFLGSDSFTYQLSDGRGGTATGVVTVRVIARVAKPIPAPVARPDVVAVPANRSSVINLGANDALQLLPLNVTLSLTNPPQALVTQGQQASSVTLAPLVPAPQQFTFSHLVSDGAAQTSRGNVFVTFTSHEHTISGQLRNAFGTGIPGELVALDGAALQTVRTDANGRYAFTGLAAGGNYRVTAVGFLGFFFAPATRTYAALQSDQLNQDFQALRTYTLTAEVRDPMLNLPVPGKAVELLSGGVVIETKITGTNGLATFAGVAGLVGNQEYTVRPVKDGTEFTPAEVTIFLTQNETVTFNTSPPQSLFSFGASSYSLSETGKVLVTVLRSGDTNDTATVRVTPLRGTAELGSDYVLADGSFFNPPSGVLLTFGPGETSKTVAVIGVDDSFFELEETFTLRLTEASSGSALGSLPTAVVTITDDDPLPTVSFTQAEVFTDERAGTVKVTLRRTGNLSQPLLVGVVTENGTAQRGVDFLAAFAGTQFAPGEATIPVTYNVTNDFIPEGVETFSVRLVVGPLIPGNDYVVGSIPSVRVFISDEAEPAVEWVEAERYASEGDGRVTLTAKRSGDWSRALQVPVILAPAISSAQATNDVILPTSFFSSDLSQTRLNFGAGEKFASLIVTLVSNAGPESLEVAGFIILPGSEHTVGVLGTNRLFIVDQESPPLVVFDRAELTVSEGAGPATLTLRRLGRLSDAFTVQLGSGSIASNAADFADFTFGEMALFTSGQTTASVPFQAVDDGFAEMDEVMLISILNVSPAPPSGPDVGSPSSVLVTLRDNDGSPRLRLTSSTLVITRSLPEPGGVGVERLGPLQPGLTFQPQVTGGTATGAEFGLSTSPIAVPPNVSISVVPITVFTNFSTSNASTVNLSLSGSVTTPNLGVVNLSMNPAPEPPVFSFVVGITGANESDNPVPVLAVRRGDTSQSDFVSAAIVGGSASAFLDFSPNSLFFSFPPGATIATNTIAILQDTVVEGTESVRFSLGTPWRGTVSEPLIMEIFILDDDHDSAIARDDSVSVSAGSNVTFSVTLNDSILSTNTLLVVTNGTAQLGSCTISTSGVALFIPAPGVTQGFETIQYEVRGLTSSIVSTGLVGVAIVPQVPNRPPVVRDNEAIVQQGGFVVLNVTTNDLDPDLDALFVLSFSQPAEGTVSRTGIAGELRYDAPPGFTGIATFLCTISDGRGGAVTQMVRIGVFPAGPGNRVPFAFDDAVRVCRPFAIFNPLLNDRDPDGHVLSVDAIILNPLKGSLLSLGGGRYRYTPFAGQIGTDSMTYRISDGNGGLATAVVRFTLNQQPNAVTDLLSTQKDKALITDLFANDTDPENDVLNLIAVTQPRFGTLAVIGAVPGRAQVRYTPPPGFTGVDTFTYRVSDGCDTVTGVARVKVNHPPVAVNDYASVQSGRRINLRPLANDRDPEGGPIFLVGFAPPGAGVAAQAGNVITYTAPNNGFIGVDRFTYTIADADGGEAQATIFIGNEPFNNPPFANDDHFNLDLALTNTLDAPVLANDSDPDADWIVVANHTAAVNGIVTNLGGTTLRYTPNPGFSGIDRIAYTISDGRGGADAAYLVVTVCPTNHPANLAPIAVSDVAAVTNTGFPAISILVVQNDLATDGPILNLISVGKAANGQTSLGFGNIVVYQPNAGFTGVDSFTYTIGDGAGNTAGGIVTVLVLPAGAPANQAPVATNDVVFALPNSVTLIEPLGNDFDADNDPLSIVGFTGPTNGVILPAGAGRFLYKPDALYAGPDSISYTVADGRGGTANAVITIVVPGLFSFGPVADGGTNYFQITLPPYDPALQLQSTTNLNPPVVWSFITNTPLPPGPPTVLRFLFDSDQRYFRLVR